MKKMFCTFLGLVAMVGCTDNFKRDNPYDPKAPTGIQEPASLCGYVVSSREGAPVSGADVNIVELGRTVTTNDMGIFEFESVPAADWTIEVSVPDGLDSYLPSVRRISLEPGMVIECPPSGQEVPEVQTIVLRRRPDAPRIIDLSADDEGVVLTFSTESKLTSKRYQLHFESVFVGSDEGARPTFEESDVDIVFENDNLTIATLRPFQNGMVEALSPTNTYDLSIRVFDEDLASTYSDPVRYAHRLVFDQCAYNDDQSINNELCAPLDGTLPVEPDAQPTEIDVLDNEYVLVERDDCTIGVWKTEGEYLGCVSFAVDLNDGLGAQCNLSVEQDNIRQSGENLIVWQVVGDGPQSQLVVNKWRFDEDALTVESCQAIDQDSDAELRRPANSIQQLVFASNNEGSWNLLLRDSEKVELYQDGSLIWQRQLNDDELPFVLRDSAFAWMQRFGDYLILNSRRFGENQGISLIEIETGKELDSIVLSQFIVSIENLSSNLFAVVQQNGDLMIVEFLPEEMLFKEVEFIPSELELGVTETVWLQSIESSSTVGEGVLALLDQASGIIHIRAVGYRLFSQNSNERWLVDVEDRGLGTNTFQTPILTSRIAELEVVQKFGQPPSLIMRTEAVREESSLVGTFEFSP